MDQHEDRTEIVAPSAVSLTVPWVHKGTADGTATFRLASWSHFFDFIEQEVFGASEQRSQSFVWRGQRRSDWSLSTTLDRYFDRLDLLGLDPVELELRSAEHLEAFQYAARGRRGTNPAKLLENEWWALGQHFGLATPLLDWTRSPFAAAYFAFEEAGGDQSQFRAIYALDRAAVEFRGLDLEEGPSFEKGRLPIIEFIESLSDENPRLVSQGGLFSRAPIGTPIEQWISRAFEGVAKPILLRIEIPNEDRLSCLKTLDRMNINHSSLFPDLAGASRATNLKLELNID